jgi:hypothetical protein
VVDFRGGYDAVAWSPLWQEFYCDWRDLWFNQRVEPPSWVLADEAMAAGAKGVLFGSRIAPGGMKLVLYDEMLGAEDTLSVYDPAGALPKNQIRGADERRGKGGKAAGYDGLRIGWLHDKYPYHGAWQRVTSRGVSGHNQASA